MEEQIQNYLKAHPDALRVEAIAAICTGERAEAAKRVIYKRAERLKWIQGGMSIEQAQTFVRLTFQTP